MDFWRDRLFIEIFSTEKTDLILAAFRIPDFFYYLFIGATVSVIFIPRISNLENKKDQDNYFSSFLWVVSLFFGILAFVGMVLSPWLTPLFAGGFSLELQTNIAQLARWLFGSVFLLALSSVFMAYLQYKQKFFALALAPIFYKQYLLWSLFFTR